MLLHFKLYRNIEQNRIDIYVCNFGNEKFKWRFCYLSPLSWLIQYDELMIFFSYFSQKTGLDISDKLSIGDNCVKCQILFSGKNKKKHFKMSSAEKFIQKAKGKGSLHQ